MKRIVVLLLLASAVQGCASSDTLRPAPAANQLPGPSPAAVSTEAGVRLEVRTDVEHARDLARPLIPLFVKIENNSGRDLVVRPQVFHLITGTGVRHQAVPPDRLRRPVESPVAADVAIAMQALPQDVLGTSGKTEGFLYFEEFEIAGPVTLTFELRAQAGDTLLGLIRVPLVMKSEAGAVGPGETLLGPFLRMIRR